MKINDKDLARFATSQVSADKEGWLWKKGELNTSYQKRWCVLKGNLFFYFDKKTDKEPIGVIVLENSFVQLADGADSSFTFSIHFTGEGSRVYKLTADDELSCTSWIKALSNCTYRYLKILVDVLEQNVETLEAKKNHQNRSSPNDYSDDGSDSQLKLPNKYDKAKCPAQKRFSKGLKKSKSMSYICDGASDFEDENDKDGFLNVYSGKTKGTSKKLSKSQESLSRPETSKAVKKKYSNLKRSSPQISKKSFYFKSSRNVQRGIDDASFQTYFEKNVEKSASKNDFSKKPVNFITLHEQYRKDIIKFVC